MIARFGSVPWALALVACSGNDADLTDLASDRAPVDAAGDDDDDDSESGDSGVPDDGVFDIYYLQVDAAFGYDASTGSVVGVQTPYGEIPPAITISLGEKRWRRDDFSSDSDAYCLIVLPLDRFDPSPPWVQGDPSLWFGFDYRLDSEVSTDCGSPDYAFDTGLWPRDIGEVFATYDWGVAIGSLRPEHEENFATSILLPHLVGARINNTLIQTAGGEGVIGYVAVASEIDAAHNLVVRPDGSQPFYPSGSIADGGGIVSGYYQILPLYIFTYGP